MFVQGVMQKSPLIGGFALSAMVLGWPIGATVGVRVGFRRFGVRAVLRVGGVLLPLGSLVFHRPRRGEFAHRRGPWLARRRASAWASPAAPRSS